MQVQQCILHYLEDCGNKKFWIISNFWMSNKFSELFKTSTLGTVPDGTQKHSVIINNYLAM